MKKEAKCTVSFERKLPGGGYKSYVAGVIYPIDDLPVETVKAFFEHPTLAPPRGVQTRTTKRGEGGSD